MATATERAGKAPRAPRLSEGAWALVAICALGALWRLGMLFLNDHVGQGDQIAYLNLARDLLGGHLTPSIYPPGHPTLIALVLALGAPLARAPQLASLVAGVLLIPLGYGLARRAFDRTAALLCALIIALHPGLVRISINGMSEATFTLFVYGAILATMAAAARPRLWGPSAVTSGALLGLAYLTRPEGVIYGAALIGLLLLSAAASRDLRFLVRAGVCALPLCLAVVAYTALVVKPQTGHWALTAKPRSFVQSYEFGRVGEKMRTSVDALSQGPLGLDASARPADDTPDSARGLRRLVRNYDEAYRCVLPTLLDGLLVVLVGLGCLAHWRQPANDVARRLLLSPLLMVVVAPALWLNVRLFEPALPCFILWAAYGLATVDELAARPARSRFLQYALLGLLLLAYAKPNYNIAHGARIGACALEEKTAGAWLDGHLPPGAILMERKSVVAFYARRAHLVTPYESLPEIVNYARSRGAEYLVVSERHIALRPQLAPLLAGGRHPGLTLFYDQPTPPGWLFDARIRVYRVEPEAKRWR